MPPVSLRCCASPCRGTPLISALRLCGRQRIGGLMNGCTNARISRATADVARHGGIDIGITRLGIARQQRRSGLDLTTLAVAALRYVQADPGRLYRLARRG